MTTTKQTEETRTEEIVYKTGLISVKRYSDILDFLEQHPSAYNRLVLTYVDGSDCSLKIRLNQNGPAVHTGPVVLSVDKIYSQTRDRTYDFNDFSDLVRERADARGISLSEEEIKQRANYVLKSAEKLLAEKGFDGTPENLSIKNGVAGYYLARVKEEETLDTLKQIYEQIPKSSNFSFTIPIIDAYVRKEKEVREREIKERDAAEQNRVEVLDQAEHNQALNEVVEMLRTALDKQKDDNLSARVGGYVPNMENTSNLQQVNPPETRDEQLYVSDIGTLVGFPMIVPTPSIVEQPEIVEFRRVPTLPKRSLSTDDCNRLLLRPEDVDPIFDRMFDIMKN